MESGQPLSGEVIKAQREGARLTIQQLADLVGCDQSYIWKLENGRAAGSKYFLDHLARVLADVEIGAA